MCRIGRVRNVPKHAIFSRIPKANRFISRVVLVGISAVTFGTLIFLKPPIVAVYILLILGGGFFVGISFSRRRLRSRWARGLLIVTGMLLVVMEAVDLLRYYALWMPSAAIQHAVLSMIPIVEGIVLGLLIALILSGELVGRKILSNSQTVQPGNAATKEIEHD